MALMSLLAGLAYPSLAGGIDSLRMRTAADSLAAFLNQGMARVERLQQPVEISFQAGGRRFEMRGLRPEVIASLDLPDGVAVSDFTIVPPGAEPGLRSILLQPGSPFPAAGFILENRRGARRIVRIDPIAGVPVVTAP